MKCLLCNSELKGWKRMLTSQARFCSDAHAETWKTEINQIALQRLLAVRTKYRVVYGLTDAASLRKAS